MPDNKEFRYACVITAGELDPNWYGRYLKNDLHHFEVVKNNVTMAEAQKWRESLECMKRVHELEQIGREKFGKDYWMKYSVSYFITSAMKDKENSHA